MNLFRPSNEASVLSVLGFAMILFAENDVEKYGSVFICVFFVGVSVICKAIERSGSKRLGL